MTDLKLTEKFKEANWAGAYKGVQRGEEVPSHPHAWVFASAASLKFPTGFQPARFHGQTVLEWEQSQKDFISQLTN